MRAFTNNLKYRLQCVSGLTHCASAISVHARSASPWRSRRSFSCPYQGSWGSTGNAWAAGAKPGTNAAEPIATIIANKVNMANLRIADLLPPEPPARSRCRSVSDTSELCNDPIAWHVEGSGGSLRAAASGINPLSAEAGIAACSRSIAARIRGGPDQSSPAPGCQR